MNTTHTPSPWKYRPLPTCDWGVVLCADGFICQAKDPAVTDADLIRHRADRTDPYEANARLIAAAPDMYAVLCELAECSQYWSDYDVPLGIHDRIVAALAKAAGQ